MLSESAEIIKNISLKDIGQIVKKLNWMNRAALVPAILKIFLPVNPYWYKMLMAIVCVPLAFGAAQAQQLNLLQLLETSKQTYPLLKSKMSEVRSADRRVSSARTEYLPNVTLAHQYTYSTGNNVEGAFFPNEGNAWSPSGGIRPVNVYEGAFGSFTSAVLDWKIVNFGKVTANVSVARADKNRTEADYQNELFQYQVWLSEAYLLLLTTDHLTLVQQYNLQRAEAFRNTIHAQVGAGIRPGVDSSLADAEYSRARLLLLESKKNEKIYEYRLYELLGNAKDSVSVDTMHFFSTLPATSALTNIEAGNAPLLKLYQSNVALSEARSIGIRRSFYPSISLIGAGWARGSGISNKDQSYRTDFASGVNYQVYNYLFGLSLRWNLMSYARIRQDYKGEQFQKERNQFLYETQRLRQARELSEAETQFSVSLQQAQVAPVQLDAARQAFAQAQARYESGLTDLPTFSQSLVALSRAEADAYIAYSNAWRGLLMKAAAAGDLSLFLNQVR